MNEQITVNLGDRSYPIHVGEGLVSKLPALLMDANLGGRYMVITNRVVAKLHGQALVESLAAAGLEAELIAIPEGEAYKSLITAGKLYESLVRRRAERNTPIIAFGGGVIGDLAGFVAATYQRGVPFIQVPTTLLAQVDSSIGGKVAVDVGKLKNMGGAFYQPKLVVSDISLLATLPPPEIKNGLAEVIKCAVIADPALFDYLEQNMAALLAADAATLSNVVARAARIKARVVEQDERDGGLRHTLNFGHTLGHAIECVTEFGIGHGTSVALGMAAVSKAANRLGVLEGNDLERILGLITSAGLPVSHPVKRPDTLIAAMAHDKKITDGRVKFIMPTGIGNVVVRDDIDPAMVVEALSS